MATEKSIQIEIPAEASKLGDQVSDQAKQMGNQAKQMADQMTGDLDEHGRPVTEAAGKLVLASIGGVALAQDALESMLKKMVERGEQSQKEAKRRMEKLRSKSPSLSKSGLRNVTDSVRDAAELPSKSDIQGLHDQIAALTAKVDQLSKEKIEPSVPALPKAPSKP